MSTRKVNLSNASHLKSNDKRDGLVCEVLDEYNEHNTVGCVCVRCTQHNANQPDVGSSGTRSRLPCVYWMHSPRIARRDYVYTHIPFPNGQHLQNRETTS
jgi:hypothetical protein